MEQGADVAVLDAGLAGAGAALELARRGIAVTLIEQDERAINRASLRNEGKIHLGLIYANDRTLRTASLQLHGALRFRNLLKRWIGADADSLHVSTRFIYAVASDSICTIEQLAEHYAAIQAMYERALREDPHLDYLGRRPHELWRVSPASSFGRYLANDRFLGAFETEELAIDPDQLGVSIRRALERSAQIRFLPQHRVLSVARVEPYRELDDFPDRVERERRFIAKRGRWWIPNRGRSRAEAAARVGGVRRHLAGEYSADWPWLLHLALLGEFVRLPERLIRKVWRSEGVSVAWGQSLWESMGVLLPCLGEMRRVRSPFQAKAIVQGELVRRHGVNAGASARAARVARVATLSSARSGLRLG